MAIESALRARQITPYTKGEKVYCGEEIYEEGILSTEQRQGNIKVQFQGTAHFPQTLILRVRLVPIPFQTPASQAQAYPVQVQYVSNSRPKTAIPFYALSSAYGGYEALAQSSIKLWNFGISIMVYKTVNLFKEVVFDKIFRLFWMPIR